MPPPDEEEVEAALADLSADAKKWLGFADVLDAAAAQAATLGLTGFELSYLAVEDGIDQKYRSTQDLMISLLNQGRDAMTEMAAALVAAREDYERSDAFAAAVVTASEEIVERPR
jgi:hypothetical protein